MILHDLSKIQPHVNVVLSILRTLEDFAATTDASADAEVDVMHDNYEFLRTHEAVLTVYSVAAAEEMQLGLGSVVTLEHWCFSFFLYFIHFFFLYIFLLICFYLSLSNLIIQARDQASRN